MLTYCTNIHPGESWAETFANLRRFVPVVKAAVSPAAPFPIGLRLSGRAAAEIDRGASSRFSRWCRQEGCFVATVNGFPFGTFHDTPVKEDVYLPDWRHAERAEYTTRLAHLLARWLPEGGRGSLSTVPLGFRRAFGRGDRALALANLRGALAHLASVGEETGRHIVLAVEPEPGCLVETTAELVAFVEDLDPSERLRPHLGVCYDCCHQAVQFEDPSESLATLARAAVAIAHVQVSSALRLRGGDLRRLSRFSEPVYLHQAVARRCDGSLARFDDLPEALAADVPGVEEWRVHFHVPVFVERLPECETTRAFLEEILPLFPRGTPMEVETYTWSVLPPDLQEPRVTDSITREIQWVKGVLA